jgi:O-antigen ligase
MFQTDPARITYQLYRYAWKPLLFYPFAALFLSEPRTARAMVYTLIAAGVLCALQSIPQGYAGARAGGPLGSANALGAALVVPITFTFVLLIVSDGSNKRRALLGAAMLVLLRALLFSGSRGALAAAIFGVGVAGFFLLLLRGTRSSVIRFVAPIAFLSVMILLIPGVLERPNIRRALSLTEGGEQGGTLSWRIENRWWHFLDKAYDSPWTGTGRDVDLSLGTEANTPHNGYIAIAVKRGFPALAGYVIFAWLAMLSGLRIMRDPRPNPWGPIIGVLCTSSIGALLIHNIVESNFEAPFLSKVFWMYVALSLVVGQALKRVPVAAPRVIHAAPRRLSGPARADGPD